MLPIVAYNVSGEYAMVKAAAINGWINEKETVLRNVNRNETCGSRYDFNVSCKRCSTLVGGEIMTKSYDISKQAFTEAKELMPGGVNSPVRAFKSVDMDPIFMESGKGAILTDIDGNEYIDYVLSWGPLILGHARTECSKSNSKSCGNWYKLWCFDINRKQISKTRNGTCSVY